MRLQYYDTTGKYMEAEKIYHRILDINEKRWTNHPDIALIRKNW